MKLPEKIVNGLIRTLVRTVCRIDAAELERVPARGPLIIATNHVTFLEAPVVYTHLMPRPLTAFSKTETWDNPILGWLFDLWEIIPIKRGEADLAALRKGMNALDEGMILTIAPEGTRSYTGILAEGHPGVVMVALKSDAPILPVATYGHENLGQNLKRLRRTDFNIRVGRPFRLKKPEGKVNREIRRKMTDEIMYQIAVLLPEQYRGVYADPAKASTTYLEFENETS